MPPVGREPPIDGSRFGLCDTCMTNCGGPRESPNVTDPDAPPGASGPTPRADPVAADDTKSGPAGGDAIAQPVPAFPRGSPRTGR